MGCITDDYRSILHNAIDGGIDTKTVLAILDVIPECRKMEAGAALAPGSQVTGKRRMSAAPWDLEPVYVDAEGKKEKFTSPSALVKFLGLPMSGSICDPTGKKCRATSAIEIMRIAGYTVSGNGEPRKKAEGGVKLTVFHPDAIEGK
jgi:hypothetical protein